MNKVSVCIPTYNNEATIKDTIQSIITQSFTNFELIICDDCSYDKTIDTVKSIKDDRIKLHINKKNIGMPENWNNCLSRSNGKYVKLICGDDTLLPNALEIEISALDKHESALLAISNTILIDENKKIIGKNNRCFYPGIYNGSRIARISLLLNNFFGAPCNTLIRHSALLKYGLFDTKFKLIPDFDMWLNLAIHGDIYINSEYLNLFMIRQSSNTNKVFSNYVFQNQYNYEHNLLLKKYSKMLKLNKIEQTLSLLSRKMRNIAISCFFSRKLSK